jgi:regulator of protease activity HflC (stomatin/prohibitin superfamily)
MSTTLVLALREHWFWISLAALLAAGGAIALNRFTKSWLGNGLVKMLLLVTSGGLGIFIWYDILDFVFDFTHQGESPHLPSNGYQIALVATVLTAIVVLALWAAILGGKLLSARGGRWLAALWLGSCVFVLLGYLATRSVLGIILIAFPCIILFVIGTRVVATRILPMGGNATSADKRQAWKALWTVSLGTNFPCYVMEDRKLDKRVDGNPYRDWGGPGIVITGCDYAVVVADGFKIKSVREPGLSFTGGMETVKEIDLRVQQRAFDVEAITKDGIRVKFKAFGPFRIFAGKNHWPQPGEAFRFRPSAILKAIQSPPVERQRENRDGKVIEEKNRHAWDEMFGLVGAQALREIIADYTFDELCAPYEMNRNPRQEIAAKLRARLEQALEPMGLQVLGGGVGNLMPADEQPIQQRINNWQAEWGRRITAELGKGEAEYTRLVESARAQAQAEMIRTISKGVERTGTAETISPEVIALRFVEALEKMIGPAAPAALSPGPGGTLTLPKGDGKN